MTAWPEQATHIEVEAGVRYWEDATVNGIDEDNDNPTMPGVKGGAWCVRIRLSDGLVEGWPHGIDASIHYKVCDQGEYWLADAKGARLAKWKGYYVPDEFLCHGDNGYGDYIILVIGADGRIEDFVSPDIDPDEWRPTPPAQAGEGQ